MVKNTLKAILRVLRFDHRSLYRKVYHWSIARAGAQQGLERMVPDLRGIEPDLRYQYSSEPAELSELQELKMRMLHAFQCTMMLEALEGMDREGPLTVVDIGDSSGTHMRYLSGLTRGTREVEAISVDLDPTAIERITARGGKAILSRAEDLDLEGRPVDLFVTFQMVEHLHNPALFFRRLAVRGNGQRMLITVPYQRASRVGLYHVRRGIRERHHATAEHIFELSPEDWTRLLLHSGWRVERERTYFQYPRGIPLLSALLGLMWRRDDFEGFWAAIVRRDLSFSDDYLDWEG